MFILAAKTCVPFSPPALLPTNLVQRWTRDGHSVTVERPFVIDILLYEKTFYFVGGGAKNLLSCNMINVRKLFFKWGSGLVVITSSK